MDKDRVAELQCRARVEFKSQQIIILAGGEMPSGQGSLVCNYPKEGACQLANKESSGFIANVVNGVCLARVKTSHLP